MIKVYNTQEKITSEIQNIIQLSNPNIRKTRRPFSINCVRKDKV